MKDDKFSIDILLIFAISLSLFFVLSNIYIADYDYIKQSGVNVSFLDTVFSKLIHKLPIIKKGVIVRIVALLVISFTYMGFQVRKNPDEEQNLKVKLILLFAALFSFVILPFLKLHYYFNLPISIILFLAYSYAFIHLRRYFDIFDKKDEFNQKNQEFIQEKGVKTNEYSVNFKSDKGTINVVNPFRATMVLGTPGSGKSYSVVEEYIRQHIQKGFSFLVYDYKFPALANETYAFLQYYKDRYKVEPTFSVVSLDELDKSSFVNPLDPKLLNKASDAIEASQTILYNLNKEWITKKDFFAQSAISYFACCIYFLKIYENGKYCTLPHAISLASLPDEHVFKVFGEYNELKFFMTPFADALAKQAFEQLSGQTASARIPLSQLATKELFWVMGNNIKPEYNIPLDVNNPERPNLLILANSPSTQTTNSPSLGLVATQILKEINKKGKNPCSVIIDELPTMYFMGLDNLIATARSNKVSTTIGMQDLEQLKRDYGDKVAETIFNIVGNIFSGSVRSETATKLQEIFGKKKQKLKNMSVDTNTTSYSINESMDYVIPVSTISQLSQGEFVGVVADNFGEEIERKIFRGKIIVDKRTDQIREEIPETFSKEELEELVDLNFNRIIREVDDIIYYELSLILERENQQNSDFEYKLATDDSQNINSESFINDPLAQEVQYNQEDDYFTGEENYAEETYYNEEEFYQQDDFSNEDEYYLEDTYDNLIDNSVEDDLDYNHNDPKARNTKSSN